MALSLNLPVELPAGITGLDTALANVNRNALPIQTIVKEMSVISAIQVDTTDPIEPQEAIKH